MTATMNGQTEDMKKILEQEEQEDSLNKQRKQEEKEHKETSTEGDDQSIGGIATKSKSPPSFRNVTMISMASVKLTEFLANKLRYQNLLGKIVVRGNVLVL